MSRRRLIAVGSLGVLGAAGLAACSSSSSGSSDDAAATTPDSAGAATTDSAGATSAASSGGLKLAKLADVPVGSSILVDVTGGQKIIISQPTEGKVVAFSAICTHQGCTVGAGTTLKCPCHGSTFDLKTGAATQGPATKALPAVAVSLNSDKEVVLGA